MQTQQTVPFSLIQERYQSEYLTLKDLLRTESGEDHFFIMDDSAHIRDITPLSDREIIARLNRTFENQIHEEHLDMPLIALIDYLFD